MKTATAIASMILATAPATAEVVKEMTPELIREAIAFGAKTKDLRIYTLKGKRGSHGCFGVNNGQNMSRPTIASYTTPFLRVALAAHEAKAVYKEFSEANVTPEMVAPEIILIASSWAKCRAGIQSVKALVIALPGGEIVHPERQADLTQDYSNAYGATWTGQGLVAHFPMSVLQQGAEVRVVMDSGEEPKDKFDLEKVR